MTRQKYPFLRISISLTLLSALVATQSLEDKGNVTHGHLWMEGFSATSSLPSFPVLSAPISSAVSNPLCRADSMQFLESLRNATMWAVKMFDSSSKFPTGFFTGSTLDFGNFDECLSVSAMATDGETTGRSFIGKYCLTTLRIPPSKLPAPSNEALARVQYTVGSLMHSSLNEVMLASCIPSSCTGSDLRAHLGHVVPQLDRLKSFGIPLDDVQVLVSDHTCSTLEDNSGLTTGQAIMLGIIILLASLTVIGTVADYVIEKFTITKGCVLNVLTCFSLRRNVRMLFSNFKHDDALRTVSGTKVIFIVVIIYGHRDLWTLVGPLDNSSINAEKYDTLDYAIKLNGYLIVDTFFLITGFLLCYIAKEEARRFNKASSIVYLYFRRYIRLTPVYMMVVAFIPTLFVKLGSGPIWSATIGILRDRCIETWWTHALYVNNIVNRTKMCFNFSWYLAADMQLFIISVPVVFLLINKPKIGKAILGILLVASVGIPFFVIYYYQLEPIIRNYKKTLLRLTHDETYKYVYTPSYMRATPYLIGIWTGYYIHQFRVNQAKLSQMKAHFIIVGSLVIGWLPILTTTVFFQKGYKYNALSSAIFAIFQRIAWGVSFIGISYVIAAGKEWSFMKVLSWRMFVPLSRLTYSAYLLHFLPQLYSFASIRSPKHMSSFYVTQMAIADCVFTFLLAFSMSMLLEAPLINLEKLVFGNGETATGDSLKVYQSPDQKCIQMEIDEVTSRGSAKSKELSMKVRHLS